MEVNVKLSASEPLAEVSKENLVNGSIPEKSDGNPEIFDSPPEKFDDNPFALDFVDAPEPGSLGEPLPAVATAPLSSSGARHFARELARETWLVLYVGLPMTMAYLFNFSFSIIGVIFVGHLGEVELGSVALSTMFCNVTGFSLLIGVLSGFDTLASQAYGAGNRRRVGVLFLRAQFVCYCLVVFIALLWFFAGDILRLAHQDPAVTAQSERFIRCHILALFPYAIFEGMRRYMMALSFSLPVFAVSVLASALMIGYCALFVWGCGLGVVGASLAFTATYSSMIVMLGAFMIVFALFKNDPHAGETQPAAHNVGWFAKKWGGRHNIISRTFVAPFSVAVLREIVRPADLREFLRVGIPGMLMICLEWWGFEIQALASGLMGVIQLDTHTLLFNTTALFFMVPLGISIGAATRVGNLLGAGKPAPARLAAFIAIIITIGTQGTFSVLLLIFRNKWAYLFTSDVRVVQSTARVLPVVCSFMIFDALAGGIMSGILRGTGQQSYGAITNFVVYYFIGIPLGFVLAFPLDLELRGLWMGLAVATILCTIVFLCVIVFSDWKKLSDKAVRTALADGSNSPKMLPAKEEAISDAFELNEIAA